MHDPGRGRTGGLPDQDNQVKSVKSPPLVFIGRGSFGFRSELKIGDGHFDEELLCICKAGKLKIIGNGCESMCKNPATSKGK